MARQGIVRKDRNRPFEVDGSVSLDRTPQLFDPAVFYKNHVENEQFATLVRTEFTADMAAKTIDRMHTFLHSSSAIVTYHTFERAHRMGMCLRIADRLKNGTKVTELDHEEAAFIGKSHKEMK